jgi:hypothetical protein
MRRRRRLEARRNRACAANEPTLKQFTNETSEMRRKDLRRKSLPRNRSRRAKPAVSELFQALNAWYEDESLQSSPTFSSLNRFNMFTF